MTETTHARDTGDDVQPIDENVIYVGNEDDLFVEEEAASFPLVDMNEPVAQIKQEIRDPYADARRYFERIRDWNTSEYLGIHYKKKNPRGGKHYWNGAPVRSVEEALYQLQCIKSRPDTLDIYVALGTQRDTERKTAASGRTYQVALRSKENAVEFKTLFMDIDVKEGTYATTEEVLQALTDCCVQMNLPQPNMVVLSGTGGAHAYWCLSHRIPRERWQPMAEKLVAAAREFGLKFDAQCTTDAARILRVPDTLNFKRDDPLPVTMLQCDGPDILVEDMEAALARISVTPAVKSPSNRRAGELDLGLGPVSEKLKRAFEGQSTQELATSGDACLRKIDEVAANCSWIAQSLADGGVDNDNALRLLAFKISMACEEPVVTAFRLVCNRATLEDGEFEEQIGRAKREVEENSQLAWVSCSAVEAAGAKACQECQFRGHGRRPLTVGAAGAVTQEQGPKLTDFYAFMPTHSYIHMPTRTIWVTQSVNARLGQVTSIDQSHHETFEEKGAPRKLLASVWLDINRPVEQMTWAPGLPELIVDKIITDGGWRDHKGVNCLNMYLPPFNTEGGDASQAGLWIEHINRIYPNEAEHIMDWMAQRVQYPEDKLNHALVLGGGQGIGKDTILEPLKFAVGPWNFAETTPHEMLDRFNPYTKSVVLRINEARDLGDMNRFQFYDRTKTIITSPPDTLMVNEKHLRQYSILNVCGVIITTNYKTDGIYLPPDDRRHFVCWSEAKRDDFEPSHWSYLYRWYHDGGLRHVAAFLRERDLSNFDPKAPPPKTAAFWEIADANRSTEEVELVDLISKMGDPEAFTLEQLQNAAPITLDKDSLRDWLRDRKNRRALPHRLEKCGYTPVRCDTNNDGRWKIAGEWKTIYGKLILSKQARLSAARALTDELNKAAREKEEKERRSREKKNTPRPPDGVDAELKDLLG